jgi:hypothetical protein
VFGWNLVIVIALVNDLLYQIERADVGGETVKARGQTRWRLTKK